MTLKIDSSLRSEIQKDAIGRLKQLKIEKRTNLHLYDEVLPKGETLKAVDLSVPIERDTAFVFVDLAPRYNWTHPCEYHFYDAHTGKFYKKVSACLPPEAKKMVIGAKVTSFHKPVAYLDTKLIRATWTKRLLPYRWLFGKAPGERYAILFAGRAANRHTNDLEFMYRTLIDVYKFNAANIQVMNHDGTVNYFLNNHDATTIGSSLGKWPGNNTAYRMQVNGEGTRAGFQAALNTIAGQIHSDDLLFIHTNNHGGGPCDSGITDYCMFQYDVNGGWIPYYVNDFIADLGVLPSFHTLMVMMEQCRSGGFITPILNANLATWCHVATAVPQDEYSQGGTYFDPFAEDWIAGVNGSYPDGTGLKQTVDTNNDGRISAAEAFNYADAVHTYDGSILNRCPPPQNTPLPLGDTPTESDSPVGYGNNIFLGLPPVKHWPPPYEAIDPLFWVLPPEVYQRLIEKFHPHVPSLSQAAKALSPAQKKRARVKAVQLKAFAEKAMAEFG
jgi:hypothetical protein